MKDNVGCLFYYLSPSFEILGNEKRKWYVCSGFIQTGNFQITPKANGSLACNSLRFPTFCTHEMWKNQYFLNVQR